MSYGHKGVYLASSASKMSKQMSVSIVLDLIFASGEAVSQNAFRETVKRTQNINAIVVYETHTDERWTRTSKNISLFINLLSELQLYINMLYNIILHTFASCPQSLF